MSPQRTPPQSRCPVFLAGSVSSYLSVGQMGPDATGHASLGSSEESETSSRGTGMPPRPLPQGPSPASAFRCCWASGPAEPLGNLLGLGFPAHFSSPGPPEGAPGGFSRVRWSGGQWYQFTGLFLTLSARQAIREPLQALMSLAHREEPFCGSRPPPGSITVSVEGGLGSSEGEGAPLALGSPGTSRQAQLRAENTPRGKKDPSD